MCRPARVQADVMEKDPPDIVVVTNRRISCVGQGAALGHPKVWYQIPEDTGWVECGYCDRRFVLAGSKAEAALEIDQGDSV